MTLVFQRRFASIGHEATFGLIDMVESANAGWSERVLNQATDRFERRLTTEISGLREEFHRTLHEGLTAVRQEIATTRFELLKWSILFWIGQAAVVGAMLSYMVRASGR